ncbi:thymidylate kinase [Orientia tsutsugamushi str. Gilliam]|uniref:Thymidylate kinase n=2 Tax=Orientia tsutsugamushi TaxID=784 RepID=A0A0F3MC50_ORITS|nr:dTMP kinase [Orientia tsutsugamushi]KJV75180.1 thymidylate kinase [Orientia tsutsugamushi str. TA763]KJV53335.1 thymidylate kinase [Orientia tsutsugamushi str. Gilliam]KJW07920.1 thymidylate kinase [Orientia tsutsugamushi str. UT144]SPP24035.1 thymidylate kinase [Orientia tsutsugamushi]SPR08840.1 thymidylate kinase [Orientia tsutsugamushi str. Gilliam]
MSNTTIGKFITFEGNEGSGKTTQSKLLYEKLLDNGIKAVWTREIGGTDIAELIRDIVLFKDMSITTELLLIMAARYEHIEKFIRPNLNEGKWVICDRFIDSTLCYQSKNSEEQQLILELHRKLLDNFFPDLTLIINVSPSIAMQRIKIREIHKNTNQLNKFDSRSQQFHQKITDAFIQVSKLFPERIVQINGEPMIEDVSSEVINIINNKMKVNLLR